MTRETFNTALSSLASKINRGLAPADHELIARGPSHFSAYPFTLGVASGDPLPDSVVLWTKLAPEPLAEDGLGGMPNEQIPVKWELAEDVNFQYIAQEGYAVALPELNHSVHVEIAQLQPQRYYYYRFISGKHVSSTGRTKTAPVVGAPLSSLAFAMASCQAWYHGYYTAYRHMTAEDLDFVLFLGDYIYEYPINEANMERDQPLSNAHNTKVVTLDQYRLRYALFKTDPDLQAAHAAFPWVLTWDDHEVENNYADEHSQYDAFPGQFLLQRSDAYQAYYENLPLRQEMIPQGPDMKIYRHLSFGNLMEMNVLDTRQYRDNYFAEEPIVSGEAAKERFDPERTILGKSQKDWLFQQLKQTNATWNVLAQQVVMAEIDRDTGEGEAYSIDQWDGFAAEREQLFSAWKKHHVRNPIVLSGDIHRHVAANLKADFQDVDAPTIGSEFVVSSISSNRDGAEQDGLAPVWLSNDHVKMYNAQRGYIRCRVSPDEWISDYLVLPYVTSPGAPLHLYTRYKVTNGDPNIQQIAVT